MIVIATDEAGYGPKLGPLVVAATAWRLPDSGAPSGRSPDAGLRKEDLQQAFEVLAQPITVDGLRLVVDDSKAVFQPRSSGSKLHPPYASLQRMVTAGCRWCGLSEDRLDLVSALAKADLPEILQAPWLTTFADQLIDTDPAREVELCWRKGNAQLLEIETRVITADAFNRACDRGMNKSDLLSGTTLGLVKSLLGRLECHADEAVSVFCDRHGGRRYYAGPIQSVFDGTLVRVIQESKAESAYRVPYSGGEFSIRFTVKGDSFTPVAFSSIVAKYLREKAMESLNAYFSARHEGEAPLRPTAGYPVDADRFLDDVAPTITLQAIDRRKLIRER